MDVEKKKAFTLAEVLITLGIIGIVAAITIPTLMQNIQDQQFKQMWKKEYSVISQAYERAKDDEGGDISAYFVIGSWGGQCTSSDQFLQKMSKYMLLLKDCSGWTSSICGTNPAVPYGNNYKALNLSTSKYVDNQGNNFCNSSYVLKDGTLILSRQWNYPSGTGWSPIWVDVNGYAKGPNVLGRDLFGLLMGPDKLRPMGAQGTGLDNTCNTNHFVTVGDYGLQSGSEGAGAGCSMEYLSQ